MKASIIPRGLKPTLSASLALILASVGQVVRADYLTTTTTVGGNTGWNTSGIWKTNGTGTAVGAPVAGNTYGCLPNGTLFGNGTANTRMRNLYAGTSTNFQTFPGDSLTMFTNTEFRFKQIAAGNVPVVNFPGVNGNPGLILDGGVLNAGDDAVFTIAGVIQIASQSYLCPGDSGGGGTPKPTRGFTISGQLTGSGTLVLFQGTTNTPHTISGKSNTFNGQWVVKAGRLVGTAVNSLGTNSITLDPNYVLPNYFSTANPIVDIPGPAVLEPNYDLNSAGALTMVNGGKLRLHQNLVFSAVTIEGTQLSAGTHYFPELAGSFPSNIEGTGSGSITVQPYGAMPVLFSVQPQPQKVYAGATAHFTALASTDIPITYQWLKNGVALTDGGNISGATTTTLTISNVASASAANYSLRATTKNGPTTSSTAALTLLTPQGTLETAVANAKPVAFYRLNESTDPGPGSAIAFDNAGGFNGTYGATAQNGFTGIVGPRSADGFAGFGSANIAAQFGNPVAGSHITVPAWNLNANTVTLSAWINPSGAQAPNSGLIFCRGNGTVAGLNFGSAVDPASGNIVFGYTWNNEYETYSWNSGITAPVGQWSYVALVVTPTNVTIHVMNTNGLASSSRAYSHVVQNFAGTTMIGDDSLVGDGTRAFNGAMDDVAVFNRALSKSELLAIYSAAAGAVNYAPIIAGQPQAYQTIYQGQPGRFTVVAGGTEPVSYQWKAGPSGGPYVSLNDGGNISGATTPSLTISNLTLANSADYIVTISNPYGSTNSAAATLVVYGTSPAENITMSAQEAAGSDWDIGSSWSDLSAASVSAAAKPGSTYELLAGARLRTPQNPRTAIFPGDVLTVDGDGVRNVNPAAGATIAEIRFKQPNPGSVWFKKLVMNGGQLDIGNDGFVVVGGEINVLANTPINNDGGNDRGYQIDAQLTGTGNIEYWGYVQSGFMPNYVNTLNITGTNNTFSGKWNVVFGTLLGTGLNALGTNDIVVGTAGALQTTYDVRNPNANLTVNGRMYLNQNDTFNTVFVGGVALAAGTYTSAQLSAAYPAYFPTSWTPQVGATNISTASGSITVLSTPLPTITTQPAPVSVYPTVSAQFGVQSAGTPPLSYQWRKDGVNLTDGGNISGALTTNLTLASVAVSDAGDYDVVVANAIGSVTSIVATLTILPTGDAQNFTLNYGGAPIQEPIGTDWNTITNWSDGNAASLSALANPGSSYEVVAGSRLRSPAGSMDATFPGDLLTVDGDGVWINGAGATIGEIRFKHAAGGTVRFKKLVMNGGQLDSATDVDGTVIIAGEMSIQANTPLYNDAVNDRGFRIDAWLNGSASIEYHAYAGTTFNAGYTQPLNIAGKSNTYSGTWNVVQGVLLGSALNSLGTNSITVGTNAALETSYDLNSPGATLVLDGQMFLHQNDTFRDVIIGGVSLTPGTYTYAQLAAAHPANFPATWTPQSGSSVSTASGKITVLGSTLPPVTLGFQFSTSGMQLSWTQGSLLEATNVTGPWTTNNVSSPFTVTPTEPKKFYRVQVQ